MAQTKAKNTNTASFFNQHNQIETLNDGGSSFDQNSLMDRLFGAGEKHGQEKKSKQDVFHNREFSLFNYQNYYEKEIVKRQIKELTEQIKKEIELIKKADQALLAEIKDIEKLTIESLPEKPGIYHIRFLEIVLRILKTMREKIGESKTWMTALMSKKKKRGSLFASLSKKKGTQYSLSQELTNARSVQ